MKGVAIGTRCFQRRPVLKNFETEELCQLVILGHVKLYALHISPTKFPEHKRDYFDSVVRGLIGKHISAYGEPVDKNWPEQGAYTRWGLTSQGEMLLKELSLKAYFPFWRGNRPGTLYEVLKIAADELKQRWEKTAMENEKDWEALGRYTDAKERVIKFSHERNRIAAELQRLMAPCIKFSVGIEFHIFDANSARAMLDNLCDVNYKLTKAADDMDEYAERAEKDGCIRVPSRFTDCQEQEID